MSRLCIDAEEEAFVLQNEWDIAIPFSFTDTAENGLSVSAFPLAEDIARAWLSRFEQAPLSDEAFAFLFAKLPPLMQEKGYFDTRHRNRYGHILRAVPGEWTAPSDMPAQAVLLTAADESGNRTTYDLAATADAGCFAYGVKEGGEVLSLAVTHDPLPEEDEPKILEVGVETVPAARRRGLAVASLVALTMDLTARGITVEYRHFRDNRGSGATARRAGFCRVGSYYYYCFEHKKRR